MKSADRNADYYAFSDQDDVWLPKKIKRAIEWLEKENQGKPLLYASKTKLVDEQLKIIPVKIRKYAIEPDFGNALIENICTGCTEVFNKELLDLVNKQLPQFTVMHDWWLYLSAAAFGTVVYDKKSGILYRQHRRNEVGMRSDWIGEFRARMKNFKKSNGALRKQAAEFRRIYGTNYKNSQLTDWVADYKKNFGYRWKLVTSKKVYRQGKLDDLIFRGLFLIGLR